MKNEEKSDEIDCDGINHYDSDGNFIESCPEAGTWTKED